MTAEAGRRHRGVRDDADRAERRQVPGVRAVGHHQRGQERRHAARGARSPSRAARRAPRSRSRPARRSTIAHAITKNSSGSSARVAARRARRARARALRACRSTSASAKSRVTPASVRKSDAGNPAITASALDAAAYTPTSHANAIASQADVDARRHRQHDRGQEREERERAAVTRASIGARTGHPCCTAGGRFPAGVVGPSRSCWVG